LFKPESPQPRPKQTTVNRPVEIDLEFQKPGSISPRTLHAGTTFVTTDPGIPRLGRAPLFDQPKTITTNHISTPRDFVTDHSGFAEQFTPSAISSPAIDLRPLRTYFPPRDRRTQSTANGYRLSGRAFCTGTRARLLRLSAWVSD